MTSENVPAAAASGSAPASWPVLTAHERRVLGVLVEKAKTTPEAYPLSLNALLTGCNQKSNRDPILNLQDYQAEEALTAAQKKQLVFKVIGGRVERWRHALYEAWKVNKVELAILGELLLRGPQTEGELRSRASRMEPIDDLETLRAVLKTLADRGLVVYLTPEGRRGTVVTHGFHAADELTRLRATAGAAATAEDAPAERRRAEPAAVSDESAAALRTELAEARTEIAALRGRLDDMETTVKRLAEQLRALKESLGA